MEKEKSITEMSYEEAINALELVIQSLEDETNPLEKSLALYERGQVLARYCAELLKNAEIKIQTLTYNEDISQD
ncbi:MAG: exodeoxyribonuclease VII small subunit [Anaerolineae bacterium]|nr:exodeoxyribonuclease VII small subunit [Anaerolineae bacterium]